MDENPFSPGYGQQPPYLAGRDQLIQRALTALRRGPGSVDYHLFLIGPRGTGKTVTLDAATLIAVDQLGAVVVRWTAGSRTLEEAISLGRAAARKQLQTRWRRGRDRVDASASVGVPGVVTATAASRPPVSAEVSAFGALEHMATEAKRRDRTVIMLVDEAHVATPGEIAALAAVMQELGNVRRLPVAVWAAGLPEARHVWLDAASPLERQRFTPLDSLGLDDAAAAFAVPIREAGREIADATVEHMARSSYGFPYVIQLIGAYAWDATPGPVIDRAAADVGIAAAVAELRDQLFVARWRQMTPALRDYLAAAAELVDADTGIVASSAVARRLAMTTRQLSDRRAQLIEIHQVLSSAGRDQLTFTQPGMAAWLRTLGHRPAPRPSPVEQIMDAWGEHSDSGPLELDP